MSAPIVDRRPAWSEGVFSAMILTCCVSHAVSPTKMNTPTMEIIQSRALLRTKKFTTMAMTSPKRAMVRKLPMRERSRLVK